MYIYIYVHIINIISNKGCHQKKNAWQGHQLESKIESVEEQYPPVDSIQGCTSRLNSENKEIVRN